MKTQMTKDELKELLEELGFKLIGSRFIGKAKEGSDYDYATTDEEIYKETLKLLKKSGRVKYVQETKYKDVYQGSVVVGRKEAGTKDRLNNPVTSDGYVFDIHCVKRILPREKQVLLYYKKHGI